MAKDGDVRRIATTFDEHAGGDILQYVRNNATALSFPEKLMYMMMSVEKDAAYRGVLGSDAPVGWDTEGTIVVVWDTAQLETTWFPRFFGGNCKFKSFTRKLYRWGFKKLRYDDAMADSNVRAMKDSRRRPPPCFHHIYFQRNDKNLIYKMENTTRDKTERNNAKRTLLLDSSASTEHSTTRVSQPQQLELPSAVTVLRNASSPARLDATSPVAPSTIDCKQSDLPWSVMQEQDPSSKAGSTQSKQIQDKGQHCLLQGVQQTELSPLPNQLTQQQQQQEQEQQRYQQQQRELLVYTSYLLVASSSMFVVPQQQHPQQTEAATSTDARGLVVGTAALSDWGNGMTTTAGPTTPAFGATSMRPLPTPPPPQPHRNDLHDPQQDSLAGETNDRRVQLPKDHQR